MENVLTIRDRGEPRAGLFETRGAKLDNVFYLYKLVKINFVIDEL